VLEHDSGRIARDEAVARAALTHYDFGADATLRMIRLSENATFVVESESWDGAILRVHRENYHSREAISSELDWMAALRSDGVAHTPEVRRTIDGQRIVSLELGGVTRHAVLFERIDGVEPGHEIVRSDDFKALGALTADLHAHSRRWNTPQGFTRFCWNYQSTLGSEARWGHWQNGFAIGDTERDLFGRAAELVRIRLARYGTGQDRFGLVHADLRLANLLVGASAMHVIDFDDCGFSWYLYDLATALSFIEHHPNAGSWCQSWVDGYRSRARLDAESAAIVPTMIMLRRLMLVAWLGSHRAATEAQELGGSYTETTIPLAERYLATQARAILAS
jgi:Ser/Thr protein kinase RdoA (MazF antagonist)